MEKEFDVTCPYCLATNELNINDYDYYLHQPEMLKSICECCGNIYYFEIHIRITAESFQFQKGQLWEKLMTGQNSIQQNLD